MRDILDNKAKQCLVTILRTAAQQQNKTFVLKEEIDRRVRSTLRDCIYKQLAEDGYIEQRKLGDKPYIKITDNKKVLKFIEYFG